MLKKILKSSLEKVAEAERVNNEHLAVNPTLKSVSRNLLSTELLINDLKSATLSYLKW